MTHVNALHRTNDFARPAASFCLGALAVAIGVFFGSSLAGQDFGGQEFGEPKSVGQDPYLFNSGNNPPTASLGVLPELVFPKDPKPPYHSEPEFTAPKQELPPPKLSSSQPTFEDPRAMRTDPAPHNPTLSAFRPSVPTENLRPLHSNFPERTRLGSRTLHPVSPRTPAQFNSFAQPPVLANHFVGSNQQLPQTSGVPFQPLKPIPADEPKIGENFFPQTDHPGGQGTWESQYSPMDFSPDPTGYLPFDPWSEADVYEGKKLNANQRPLVELGKPFYQLGQLPVSQTFLGRTNLMHPRFQIFGDFRTAVGFNGLDGDYKGVWGAVLNLEMDLRITATERFHALVAPLDRAGVPTRLEFDDRQATFINNTDFEFDTGFFEGDLGALAGGAVGEVLPFDLPIAVGAIPLLYQNGIWMNDAFIGMAAAIPARNSPQLDISNFDVVFFWGFDNITSPAFQGDDNAAKMYGIQMFLETLNGYIESGYAYLEDRSTLDRSYHNMTVSYSRRYGRFVSNSVRVLANAGQNPNLPFKTADGVLLLVENSLITQYPSRVVPYCNLFAGFGRPQSVARQANAGGVLQNTGINFETDGVTNFPILDPSANDTYGAALGVNILAPEFTQQIILETAFLDVMGNDPSRTAQGHQIGFGIRYQLPISNAVIFRADAMHGIRQAEADLSGFRVELRHKF